MVALFEQLNLTDVVVIIGVVAVVMNRLAEYMGWSKSSATLRSENSDLVRYNAELENSVKRLEGEIERLKATVAELEKTNVAAAIASIDAHERAAGIRAEAMVGLLSEIRDNTKPAA